MTIVTLKDKIGTLNKLGQEVDVHAEFGHSVHSQEDAVFAQFRDGEGNDITQEVDEWWCGAYIGVGVDNSLPQEENISSLLFELEENFGEIFTPTQ